MWWATPTHELHELASSHHFNRSMFIEIFFFHYFYPESNSHIEIGSALLLIIRAISSHQVFAPDIQIPMFTRALQSATRALPRVTLIGLASQRVTLGSTLLAPSMVRFASNQPIKHKPNPQKSQPRIRYLFYMVVLSWAVLYFVTGKVDKKQPKNTFASEREFRDYEEQTGLKRRNKLINHEKNEQYRFYVVPYVTDDYALDSICQRIKEVDPAREVKVIDPKQLIETEKLDETRKYSYLLQDLDARNHSYPKGLVTALIKNEVAQFLNTRLGTFDTNIVIKNYPQSTDEAIKFENDISDIQKCLIVHYDIVNTLPDDPDLARNIGNVVGYFNTVGRVKEVVSKHNDRLDSKLKEIMLEDL